MTEGTQNEGVSYLRRALWHLNRSPAVHLVKAGARLARFSAMEARRSLARALPSDDHLKSLAMRLNADGYVFLDGIFDADLLASLDVAGARKLDRSRTEAITQAATHKGFWTRLLDEDAVNGKLRTDNPFVKFALQPSVISILSYALGEIPRLDYVLLTLSRASNAPLSYSQLWHRDHDDPRTIKLFVYLTDVLDDADGPFTFFPRPVSDRFGFSRRSHRPDSVVYETASPGEAKAMKAPRLSAFMVETSRCMHMGSRVASGHMRLLYTASYFRAPRLFPEPPSPFEIVGEIDDVTRSVLAT